MAHATIELAARCSAETTYRSVVVDPLPTYPDHAGKLGIDLVSGGLRLAFSYGYAWSADIHAAIARLRDALDQLDIDVDAAMERQAAARPERTRGEQVVDEERELGAFDAGLPLPDGVEFAGTVGQFLDAITDQAPGELVEAWDK